MIAGNGRFPLLALEAARELGHRDGRDRDQRGSAGRDRAVRPACHWISLGQLGKLIEILQEAGIAQVMMCGQVKHVKIFSAIRPDWRLFKLLTSLEAKNTDALIGGVIRSPGRRGNPTGGLDAAVEEPACAARDRSDAPQTATESERKDIDYGRRVANALAGFDIGQSVAVADRACVAVEAMEGTDAMLRRAASLVEGKPLRLIKVSRRRKHMLFDVPVAGPSTIDVMRETGATALAVDAGRTLFLDREEMLERADSAGIAVIGYAPAE